MNQRQFIDAIWAYKINMPGHQSHEKMCADIVGEEWDDFMFETYKRLCDSHGLDPCKDHPFINMQMEDDWIAHAKNVGVFQKRTRAEALAHKQKLDDEFMSYDENDDYDYRDVDMVIDNFDGTQTRISYDREKDEPIEILEPLEEIT